MSFLKAEWRKLLMVNYTIDPKLLEAYVPYGTQLDLYKGQCYVSLIGFMYLNTRLLGIKVPFHTNFEEVNLRFYVKRLDEGTWKRGVVFIKEIVPKPALTWVANTVYNENYQTMPMSHSWDKKDNQLGIEYKWQKSGVWHSISALADATPSMIEPGSKTEFITEHYWGYAKVSESSTNEYEVTHPRWMQYKIQSYDVDVNFSDVYGENFGFLSHQRPDSVLLAEGSEITVESKTKIN